MSLAIPILIITVIANISIASFAYTRNPRSATHRLFAALTFVLAAWSIATYISTTVDHQETAIWLVRFVMFFSVPVGILFLLLMHTYPRASLSISHPKLILIVTAMVLTMIISLSPLLFKTVTINPGLAPQPKPGLGLILYIPVVIFGILYGIYLLIKKFIQSRGLQRVQNAYLLTGVVIMFTLIISLNFIAPNVFKTTAFIPYGPLFTLPFVFLTAYTIARYRLMDIRAAIARSISLSILIGAVLLIYGLLVIFAVPYITDSTGVRGEIVAAVTALISIPLARYIQRALTRLTDRFLFQNQIDYRRALVEASKELSTTIKIEDVTRTVLNIMEQTIRTKKTIIFLQENKDHNFSPYASRGARAVKVTIPKEHVLVRHLKHTFGPLVKDELALEREQERSAAHAAEIKIVEQTFDWLDMAVVLPLYVNKLLTGLIVLGDKKSGTPYLHDDLNFLAALAPQAATALENARLYQESLVFGEKLKFEIKRATQELEIANAQLRDLDKAKSEFLSIASHQLYTPMTALRGYLSMLQEGDYGQTSPKQKPIIKILEISANRLINLIKNLLDVSRIESGRLELNLESLDFGSMVKELVQDLMPNALNKKVKLQYNQQDETLPHVVADQERVRQVILNIVDNSIKYTDKGRIDVRVQQTDHTITLTVNDTGRGMTADEITKLFTKFTRVGGASKYRKEGTGLGLYVAKQIIREHHGDIEVTSPGMNHGSTFYVHLPIEGSPNALTAGKKVSVEIKAGEASPPVGK
ncbi:MAG TPA: hypothetical protein DDW41_00225 [Candidatus Andersenbacteria bacterium]|nr:hypothetical protein [Candidatus Andersenbacteria bacterium]